MITIKDNGNGDYAIHVEEGTNGKVLIAGIILLLNTVITNSEGKLTLNSAISKLRKLYMRMYTERKEEE